MTSDGVGGTAAEGRAQAGPPQGALRSPAIKRDDGRPGQRYIQSRYPHAPAGAIPDSVRRERQVASALRDCTDFRIASLSRGADGPVVAMRWRAPAAGHRAARPRCRPAKGSR